MENNSINSTRMKIIKKILLRRARVSSKMAYLANDIAARGRRHDNSYTDDSEMNVLLKLENTTDPDKVETYQKMLDGMHAFSNDYLPEFHNNDISRMNFLQLIEYTCHRIAEYDEKIVDSGIPKTPNDYVKYVLFDLTVSDDLKGIITETVYYIINKNESIIKSLPKDSKDIVGQVLNEFEGGNDGENKEE